MEFNPQCLGIQSIFLILHSFCIFASFFQFQYPSYHLQHEIPRKSVQNDNNTNKIPKYMNLKIHIFLVLSAMLGKQGWRLVIESPSLVARIHKARYYPSGSFLEAQLSSNLSYIWRNVLTSKQLLRSGLKWKVGVGNNVNVWSDLWLPNSLNSYVETSPMVGLEHAMVNSLKSSEGRG